MMETIKKKIQDGRVLHLLEGLLKAGYLEEWKWKTTLSGSPQGGIISPILSNIYLDRMDKYVENTLIPAYTRGKGRRKNNSYNNLIKKAGRAKNRVEAKKMRQKAQKLSSLDTHDPNFRRLWYVRYADDFLLGFSGIPLIRSKSAILKDDPQVYWGGRTEIVKRLLANACEYCGSNEQMEVHHIRKLKDLDKYPGREKPEWVKRMVARKRKTLVLCRKCHVDLHAGRPLTRKMVRVTK